MAQTKKYEHGGKSVTLYLPNDLLDEYQTRAQLMKLTRNQLIIKTLQGRTSPATNGVGQPAPVVHQSDRVEPGEAGAGCSHTKVLNLGYYTRCKDCGAQV